jgi:hypothetical protein
MGSNKMISLTLRSLLCVQKVFFSIVSQKILLWHSNDDKKEQNLIRMHLKTVFINTVKILLIYYLF